MATCDLITYFSQHFKYSSRKQWEEPLTLYLPRTLEQLNTAPLETCGQQETALEHEDEFTGASPAFGELTLSSISLHASWLGEQRNGSQDSRDISGLACDPLLMDFIHLLSER